MGNQWYFNDTILIGGTSQYLSQFENGKYYVIVTVNGCSSDASNIIHVSKSDLDENISDLLFKIYPNPSNDKITLIIPEFLFQGNLTILTLNGNELIRKEIIDSEMNLDLSNLPEGTYFLKLRKDSTTLIRKLIKN